MPKAEKDGGDRLAAECATKITPEMIEAGIWEYISADDTLETKEEIVARIFRAMTLAKTAGSASPSV